MKKLGGYIAIIGIATIVLPYLNLQLRFLGWIDNWGEPVAWAIKIGLIVIGAALFFMGGSNAKPAPEETTNVE